MKPNISVIVPAYNVEDYIDSCLKSIGNQTLKHIEVIVINDGSTDATQSIIQKYVASDSRFILINQSNSGSSSARNSGLAIASSDYILFIDSDDWISENTCENLYKEAVEKNLDVLVYNYSYVIGDRYFRRNCYTNVDIVSGLEFLKNTLRENMFSLSACNKLFRKDIIKNIEFREGYVHEDIEFNYRTFLVAKRVSAINECLYFYRRFRSGSNTSEFKVKNLIDLFEIYNSIEMEYSSNVTSRTIIQGSDYKLLKFEKLNMESLFKLIDDSNRIDDDRSFIDFLQNNHEFRSLSIFYLKNGKSIKHKIVVKFFFINPKLYIYLGRALYPILKVLKIAV